MSLISVSTDISEQQKIDTIEMLTDKDFSNNSIKQQNYNKNLVISESSPASNDDLNFTSIFDGKTLNGWKMAGEGKFVIVESDVLSNRKEEWDYYGIRRTNTRISCLS